MSLPLWLVFSVFSCNRCIVCCSPDKQSTFTHLWPYCGVFREHQDTHTHTLIQCCFNVGQRLRRWPNINSALVQHCVYWVHYHCQYREAYLGPSNHLWPAYLVLYKKSSFLCTQLCTLIAVRLISLLKKMMVKVFNSV